MPNPPNLKKPIPTGHHVDIYWSKVDVGSPDECWLWLGSVNSSRADGHLQDRPLFHIWNKETATPYTYLAYRVAYALTHGDWPKRTVDHLCNNSMCCNPDHLQDISLSENVAIGNKVNYDLDPKVQVQGDHTDVPDGDNHPLNTTL